MLNGLPESIAVPPAMTCAGLGPGCFGEDYDPTNTTHSIHSIHPTPVPKVQPQASEVNSGQVATLPSRRRNRYRAFQDSGKDASAPSTELGPGSTGTTLVKISGTY